MPDIGIVLAVYFAVAIGVTFGLGFVAGSLFTNARQRRTVKKDAPK